MTSLALAQQADQQMPSAAKKRWLDQLTVEHDNLRAALTWSLANEPPLALQLVAALTEFWTTRGHDYEARRWLAQVLAANPAATAMRAAVLVAAGNFARRQAAYDLAQIYMVESIALYERLQEQAGLAAALREAGWLAYDRHEKAVTIARFSESLAHYRQLDDQAGVASLLLCLVHVLRSEPERRTEVQAYLTESLALLRELEQPEELVWALQQEGELAMTVGNYTGAEQHFRTVLAHWRQMDAKLNIAWSVALLGEAVILQDDLATAEQCYAEAHQIFTELGNKDGMAIVRYHLGEVARRQGNLPKASRYYQESITHCQALQNRHITARSLAGLGGVALAAGQTTIAATLLGAAQRLFAELPPFLTPADQGEFTRLVDLTH